MAQFGGAQGAHGGGAVDGDSFGEGVEDLFVPDGPDLLVMTVDDSNGDCARGDGAFEVAHLDGAFDDDVAGVEIGAVEAGTGEDDLHSRATASKARQPGRQLRLAARSSRSAERIFTTA